MQHRLHAALETATAMLDLPLDTHHLERLAVELTPTVKALLAGADAALADLTPVPYAVTDDVEETLLDGCRVRVQADVDHDCPAARLGLMLRSAQHDVVATDVPDETTLGLTVHPQSLDCWRWWMHRMGIDPTAITIEGDAVTATGSCEGVTINLRGEGVPELLADKSAARLMGVIAPARP
ncbi:hypothetical protein [Streptomyces antibioticus]|uniref:hypothetical protein n=1 Tax=Streptomyces antibioticus TaxID=1890 RepID=UPI0033A6BF55